LSICPLTDSAAEGHVRPNLEAGFHFHPTTHDDVHIQYSYLTAELASELVDPQLEARSDFGLALWVIRMA
jgi:hypothetical protein